MQRAAAAICRGASRAWYWSRRWLSRPGHPVRPRARGRIAGCILG